MAARLFDRKFGALGDLPRGPGVYLFRDADGNVLYAGKAKDLRRRLAGYRNATPRKAHRKMRTLVREAATLEVRPQESEKHALLLENELIRTLRPPFNVDGAFSFLYPALGVGRDADRVLFRWPVRVYWEDTDAGGVVFYANYLRFMERARTEWLRERGFEQPAMAENLRVLFVVRAVQIDFLKPSRFNDSLQVSVEVDNVGGSRIRFLQSVLHGDEERVRAVVDVVCVSTDSFRPVRMPRELRITMGPEK